MSSAASRKLSLFPFLSIFPSSPSHLLLCFSLFSPCPRVPPSSARKGFGQMCIKLTELILSGNDFEEFPTPVCSIPSLVYLNVCNNRLTYISQEVCTPSPSPSPLSPLSPPSLPLLQSSLSGKLTALTRLDLSHNRISVIPAEVMVIQSLK